MSAADEAKRSQGPKGAAPHESGRPTRQCGGLVLRWKEAE
jgi:hypothetical protein